MNIYAFITLRPGWVRNFSNHLGKLVLWLMVAWVWSVVQPLRGVVYAQDGESTTTTGTPRHAAPIPLEMGTVDAATGNLHPEIPPASFPERGGSTAELKLSYDSNIWSWLSDGVNVACFPDFHPGLITTGGWRLVSSSSSANHGNSYSCLFDAAVVSAKGTQHWFHFFMGTATEEKSIGCSIPSDTKYATDSSGIIMTGNYNKPFVTFRPYANDGTLLVAESSAGVSGQNTPTDGNGNGSLTSLFAPGNYYAGYDNTSACCEGGAGEAW